MINRGLRIQYIDVGQGDAALLTCDGRSMLIDGGPAEAGPRVRSVLAENAVRQLDILVITHHHEDHYAGLVQGLSDVTQIGLAIGNATCCEDETLRTLSQIIAVRTAEPAGMNTCRESVQQNGSTASDTTLPILVPPVGTHYTLGAATIDVIENAAQSSNDSLVLLVTYGGTRFLFCGDIEGGPQARIVERYRAMGARGSADEAIQQIDILKVPHHGARNPDAASESGVSDAFLQTFRPAAAVISVGAGNAAGQPHEETLTALRSAGTRVYRTDHNGNIVAVSDGQHVQITVSR